MCARLLSNVRGGLTIVPLGEVLWAMVMSNLGDFKGSDKGPGNGDDKGNERN